MKTLLTLSALFFALLVSAQMTLTQTDSTLRLSDGLYTMSIPKDTIIPGFKVCYKYKWRPIPSVGMKLTVCRIDTTITEAYIEQTTPDTLITYNVEIITKNNNKWQQED